MKTEVILLQNYDNFDSLSDRIRQLTQSEDCGERILIVWSKREAVFSELREFTELRDILRQQGYPLAIATDHKRIRELAAAADIPVFSDRDTAEAAVWDNQSPRTERASSVKRGTVRSELKNLILETQDQKMPKSLSLGLIFLLILFAVALAFLFIPHASVRITPQRIELEKNFVLWTSPSLETVTITGGIPYTERQPELSYTVTVPASGSVSSQGGLASGTVTVQNRCGNPKSFQSGAIILAENTTASFHVLVSGRLEPEGSMSVRLEADEPGSAYNLPAGTQLAFSDDPESCFMISQPKAFTGGSDGVYAAPTPEDKDTAAAQIKALAVKEILDNTNHIFDDDEMILFPEDIQFEIIDEKQSPDFGYASETLTLRQTLRTSVKTVRRSQIEQLLQMLLAENEGRSILSVSGISNTADPIEENGIIRWSAAITYSVYESETNEKALRRLLSGKPVSEVPSILEILPHEGSVSVQVFPEDFPFMPFIPEQIQIEMK